MFGASSATNTGPNGLSRIGRSSRARRLVVGTSAALSAVLMLGAGTAVAAPTHAGGGWGRSTTTTPATRGAFGVYLPAHNLTQGDIALQFALSQVGKPYLYGGAGPNAYDCSGLAMVAWSKAGVSLSHYTGTQVFQGTPVARTALRPGDLVFFGNASNVYHVGLYVSGDQGGLMVDAPHTGAFVRVEQIWWSDYYTAVRPGA
jgi:cell wall-associated NlpC family hydrolase